MEIYETRPEEEKQLQLDRGYDALTAGDFQKAEGIFLQLLNREPGCGLSCLGMAMAKKRIHGKEELGLCWETLSLDPEFQGYLKPAEPDFLRWLQREMGEGEEPDKNFSEAAQRSPAFSLESIHKKPLRLFRAIQLGLYLIAAFLFSQSGTEAESWPILFVGSLMFAALVCGLPILLGSLCGLSILRGWRIRKLLKILNTLDGLLGCGISGVLVAAFHSALERDPDAARGNQFYCYGFLICFIIHLLSLLLPLFLKEKSGNEDGKGLEETGKDQAIE